MGSSNLVVLKFGHDRLAGMEKPIRFEMGSAS